MGARSAYEIKQDFFRKGQRFWLGDKRPLLGIVDVAGKKSIKGARTSVQLLQDTGRVSSEKARRSRFDFHCCLKRNGFAVCASSFLDIPCQLGTDSELLKSHFVNPTKPFGNLILLSLQSKSTNPIDAEQVNPANKQFVRNRIQGCI